jgi:hypothetical protein
MNTIEAWHFLPDDRRLRYGDNTLVEVGQTLTVDPAHLELCQYGLHASERALDALKYAPGSVICRVRLSGAIIEGDDKLCASERTVLWMADATEALRAFGRWCALEVAHLWDMPPIVRQYLETGEESIRDAARDATSAAASAAAWDAASAAAWDAAWDRFATELERRLAALEVPL